MKFSPPWKKRSSRRPQNVTASESPPIAIGGLFFSRWGRVFQKSSRPPNSVSVVRPIFMTIPGILFHVFQFSARSALAKLESE
jgi:hypothetical protein